MTPHRDYIADDRVHGSGSSDTRGTVPTRRCVDVLRGPATSSQTAVVPLPGYAEEWSELGRALVRLSGVAAAAGGWRPGDRLGLPVPQLETVYEAVIEEVDDGPGLSRAAVAAVRDGSQDRRVVVTVGPAHTFAYIDTPKGSYELLAGREFGWLLSSSSMQARFDFSKSDLILPAAADPEGDAR